ncbi:hypothetical protein [Prescottella equi]|uniref:hypothetical protein n=1 Tax=Rhodococcus hoagii TaxID=43767 RepID=UPI00131A98D9|nr:hypothetical protein [Prescottella equi]
MIALHAADTLLAITTNIEQKPPGMSGWQITFNTLTFIAAFLAAVFSGIAAKQKNKHENRAEWWRRYQWAAELAIGPVADSQLVGIAAMRSLTRGELAGKEEKKLAIAIMTEVIDNRLRRGNNEGEEATNGGRAGS